MAQIYISSTFQDLAECREEVYRSLRQLQHDVVGMEDYVAEGSHPLAKCLQDVQACDVYVGLFAFRYGYVPDEPANPTSGRSPSVNTARHGKRARNA